MAKQDIEEILKAEPQRWFSATELSRVSGVGQISITHNLSVMRRNEEVRSKLGRCGDTFRRRYYYAYNKKGEKI